MNCRHFDVAGHCGCLFYFLFCSEGACLYLQLLYQHADNLSSFVQVSSYFDLRIGVRSEDLRDSPEKSIQGSSFTSPRLEIPAAIHGLRLVPAMSRCLYTKLLLLCK
ncbi:hypothetical protein NC652_011933 [Populus alba x Populus x berolinensis]|nr:hypothetical protein NC652_011933 [Populus alba x Populus x berolinensis]